MSPARMFDTPRKIIAALGVRRRKEGSFMYQLSILLLVNSLSYTECHVPFCSIFSHCGKMSCCLHGISQSWSKYVFMRSAFHRFHSVRG